MGLEIVHFRIRNRREFQRRCAAAESGFLNAWLLLLVLEEEHGGLALLTVGPALDLIIGEFYRGVLHLVRIGDVACRKADRLRGHSELQTLTDFSIELYCVALRRHAFAFDAISVRLGLVGTLLLRLRQLSQYGIDLVRLLVPQAGRQRLSDLEASAFFNVALFDVLDLRVWRLA